MTIRESRFFIFSVSLLLLFNCNPSRQQIRESEIWPEWSKETKPWTRWWWMGNAMTKDGIENELTELSKAGFGGGLGFLVTPLVALTIPVADAAALLLPLFIITDLLTVRQYRVTYDRPSIRLMLPSALIGIVIFVNLLSVKFFSRGDLTQNRLFTLSNASVSIVGHLDDKLLEFISASQDV